MKQVNMFLTKSHIISDKGDKQMIVYFEKDQILSAVGPAMGAVSNKNTITSIEGILLDCRYGEAEREEPDICILSAYDMEKGMKTTLPVRIDEPGSCIINAQKLFQIIKALPDGELKISVDDKLRCKIEGGRSAFELRALPGEDFPNMPELKGDRGFSVAQSVIKNFISKTSFAVGINEQRASFNGFYFRMKDSEITVVTCDSNRLAMCSKVCDLENKSAEEKPLDASCIIPTKSMTEISKLLKDTDEKTEVYLARKHVIFKIGNITYFSRLIESEYMDYNRIIPKDQSTITYIDPREFRASLERASLVTEERAAGTVRSWVKLALDGQIMKISSFSAAGSVYDEIMMEHTGEDMEIGFNCRFLLDAIRACVDSGDEVKISFTSPLMGITIVPSDKPKPEGEENEDSGEPDNFLFFVMPVRMNS